MSIVPDSSLELIEHLDFEHTPQCEHSQHTTPGAPHDGPAYVLVRCECPAGCGITADLYFCRPWWEIIIRGVQVACDCGTTFTSHVGYTALGWVE